MTAPARPIRILRVIARLNIGGPAIQAITLSAEMPATRYKTMLVCGRVSPGEGNMCYLAGEKGVYPHRIPTLAREISPSQDLKALARLDTGAKIR